MLITCPKCDTSFLTSAEAIGIGGRMVKCSKCKHVWFAEGMHVNVDRQNTLNQSNLKQEEDLELANLKQENLRQANLSSGNLDENILSDGNPPTYPVPSIVGANVRGYLWIPPFIILMLSTLFYALTNLDSNIRNNAMINSISKYIVTSPDVKLEEVKSNAKIENNNKSVILEYSILNNSKYESNLPPIRIRVLSKNGRILHTSIINENVKLKPGDIHRIKTAISHIPKLAEKIDVTIGSRAELILY